jgi:hypothetical protein
VRVEVLEATDPRLVAGAELADRDLRHGGSFPDAWDKRNRKLYWR